MHDHIEYLQILNNNLFLRGTVHYPPEKSCDKRIPVVIVHGYFSANRIGPQRLFYLMSRALALKGFTVYRFDLSGMGESEGDIEKIVFSDHVDDVSCVLKYVQRIHSSKICVIAHCLGSSMTLSIIQKDPSLFREVIFMAPYYTTKEIIKRFFKETGALEKLYDEGYTYRKGQYANASYFEENSVGLFEESIENAKTVINVLIPENDQYIPLECNKKVFQNAERLKRVIIRYVADADHNFFGKQKEVIDIIIDLLTDDYYAV